MLKVSWLPNSKFITDVSAPDKRGTEDNLKTFFLISQ